MFEDLNFDWSNTSPQRRCSQLLQLSRLAHLNRYCSCGSGKIWLSCPPQCDVDAWEESEPREPVYFDGLPHDTSGFLL